jgi:hypothetical protein
MRQEDELALRVSKEIVIKFIEVGRLSLNNFDEVFKQVYDTVRGALLGTLDDMDDLEAE